MHEGVLEVCLKQDGNYHVLLVGNGYRTVRRWQRPPRPARQVYAFSFYNAFYATPTWW